MNPTNIRQSRAFSSATVPATLNPFPSKISVQPAYEGIDQQATILHDIQQVIAGDGSIRDVYVNNVQVPREFVEDAMFSNQQVMPHTDQFPLQRRPVTLVTSLDRPRSMFGPMPKSPFGLAFDVINSSEIPKVTVSNKYLYEE